MYILRIVYVALPFTDPDWDGTATERTRPYLVATIGYEWMFVPYSFRHYRSGDVTRIPSIRCANMLCQIGRTRNSYVATKFILLSSTAASSATSGYVVVPEYFGQNEGRTTEKLSFVPKVDLLDAIVLPSMQLWSSMNILVYFAEIWCIF